MNAPPEKERSPSEVGSRKASKSESLLSHADLNEPTPDRDPHQGEICVEGHPIRDAYSFNQAVAAIWACAWVGGRPA